MPPCWPLDCLTRWRCSVKKVTLLALAASLLSCAALGHHSTAEYDRSALRELDGELIEIGWRNPHVTFKLRAANEAGGAQDWELSGLPIALLAKAGLAE